MECDIKWGLTYIFQEHRVRNLVINIRLPKWNVRMQKQSDFFIYFSCFISII